MFVSQSPTRTPLGAITVLRIVTLAERAITEVANWRRRHHTYTVLSSLTDSQLTDIGLDRGQIQSVAEGLARR